MSFRARRSQKVHSTALDVRAQILSILDRRNGVGTPVFELAPPGHEHLFDLTAPDLCEPSIPDDVQRQNKIFVKPAIWLRIARPMCDGRPLASSQFRRLASRRSLFSRPFCTTQCLVERKVLKLNAVVRLTPCLATSFPPYGFANVNPY